MYEQKVEGANVAGNDRVSTSPYITITYKLDLGGVEKDGEVVVNFKSNNAVVGVTRNTLYTIKLGNGESVSTGVKATLVVNDWIPENDVTDDISASTKPYSQAAVGDFFMKDGRLLDGTKSLSKEQKKQVIGIVFQRDPNRIGETARNRGFTHGLVMALKNANNDGDIKWSEDQTQKGELKGQRKLAYNDIDGLGNTEKTELKDLTAFKAATAYNTTCPLPAGKTTGWYLPAMGELMDLAANLGGLDIEKTDDNGGVANSTAISVAAYAGKVTEVGNKINGYLSKVGNGNYDKFPAADYATNYRYYWSSSEYSATNAWSLYFSNDGNLYFNDHNKTNPTNDRVRCVFAF